MGTLNKKLKRAETSLQETEVAFERLSEGLDDELVSKWRKLENKAADKRGKHLKCYDVRHVKGRFPKYVIFSFVSKILHLKHSRYHVGDTNAAT